MISSNNFFPIMRDMLFDITYITRYEKSDKAFIFRKLIKMRLKRKIICKAENLPSKNLALLISKNCEYVFYLRQITMAYK